MACFGVTVGNLVQLAQRNSKAGAVLEHPPARVNGGNPMTDPQCTPASHTMQLTDRDIARFWAKVQKTPTCWLWTAYTRGGYGRFWAAGRLHEAHRIAYQICVGPVPERMELDHVRERGCTNRHCVNPHHLEPVTKQVNMLRGAGFVGENARKIHCIHGHPFTPENTYVKPGGGRQCRTCMRISVRKYKRARRAALGA